MSHSEITSSLEISASELPPHPSKRVPTRPPVSREGAEAVARGAAAGPSDSRSLADKESPIYEVYLSSEWYAAVDERGMVASSCAEGALGYILQLYSSAHLAPGDQMAALKIPRLRADTIAENAYICQILAGEAASVFKALSAKRKEGLVPVTATRRADLLRAPRDLAYDGSPKIREQDGCIPFVHFAKDQRVAICNVKYEAPPGGDGKPVLHVFPPTMTQAFAFFTYEHWRQLQKAVAPGTVSPDRAFYFPVAKPASDKTRPLSECPDVGLLDEQLNTERSEKIWYTFLPSIVFEWADCTLQRTLSTRSHANWRLKEHYQLLSKVLEGLRTLHAQDIIHADVRPANVMAIGDAMQPNHYMLCDYGSFTSDQATAGGTTTGLTTMPGVARHRASVFYAHERRAGVEREDADIALIIAEPPGPGSTSGEYFIRLGWKADYFDPKSNRIYPEVIADMEAAWAAMRERRSSERSPVTDGSSRDTWRLTEGDQIRLRDYVFKLIDSQEWTRTIQLGSAAPSFCCLDFRCDSNYTQVYMEKLAVRGSTFLLERSANRAPRGESSVLSLDLPRWTEIRQSSVASDLYSVGVMALYTVYTSVGLTRSSDCTQNDDTRPVPQVRAGTLEEVEERIIALIRRLEDEKNFNEYWPDLTRACVAIEAAVRVGLPLANLMALPVDRDDTQPDDKPARTFKDLVESLLAELCNLSSELRAIQTKINNYGYFLLYLHFVLSCLHRRSHLDSFSLSRLQSEKALNWGSLELTPLDEGALYPFCQDRCEKTPHRNIVVAKVLARLQRLITYFDQRLFFREFHRLLAPNTASLRGSPGDTDQSRRMRSLREDNEKLKRDVSELTVQVTQDRQDHDRELTKLKESLRQKERQFTDLQKEFWQKQTDQRQELEALQRQLAAKATDLSEQQQARQLIEPHFNKLRSYTHGLLRFVNELAGESGRGLLPKVKLPEEYLSRVEGFRKEYAKLELRGEPPSVPPPAPRPTPMPPTPPPAADPLATLEIQSPALPAALIVKPAPAPSLPPLSRPEPEWPKSAEVTRPNIRVPKGIASEAH